LGKRLALVAVIFASLPDWGKPVAKFIGERGEGGGNEVRDVSVRNGKAIPNLAVDVLVGFVQVAGVVSKYSYLIL
jgi:hypothetical protein